MPTRITKLTALSLLLLAAVPYCFLLIQQIHQRRIHREMRESLEQKILQTVTINKNEISWVEEGKEAWVDGRMFDVKKFEVLDNEYKLTGLYDDQETSLVKKFSQEQQKENLSGYKLITQLFQVFQSNGKQIPLDFFFVNKENQKFPELQMVLSAGACGVLSPPPKKMAA